MLLCLSRGPCRITAPGPRFKVATVAVSIGWGAFLLWDASPALADIVASLLIWLTALLVGFSFWSLLVWGFTVTLLMRLVEAPRPLRFDEWVAAYTGGGSAETFARDRLSILVGMGLARQEDEYVRLTSGWAVTFARFVGALRRGFGANP